MITDDVPTPLDGMNDGAATALYAIGTPVLLALFPREVVVWLVGARLATLAAAVVGKRWDDPGIEEMLYALQQKMQIIALVGGLHHRRRDRMGVQT